MKNNKKTAGIIYSAKNEVTGEFYIGVTTRGLAKRKAEHLKDMERNSPYRFHQAIATYGPETFSWNQIDTADDVNELAIKEKHYIVKNNSKDNGYNGDSGGGFKKSVYKYDIKNGRLISKYNCLDEAADSISTTKQHISRACLNVNQTYRGYYWSYNYKEPFVPGKDKRFKKVVQLDFNLNRIASYNSIAEASRQTGFSKSCIAKVCRGERDQTHGYIFEFE